MEEYIVMVLDNDECITKQLLTRCIDCDNFHDCDKNGYGYCILPQEPFQRIKTHYLGFCDKAIKL